MSPTFLLSQFETRLQSLNASSRKARLPLWVIFDRSTMSARCPLSTNRPFRVKHFQTIRRCSVDVASRAHASLGIGAKARFHYGIQAEVEQSLQPGPLPSP